MLIPKTKFGSCAMQTNLSEKNSRKVLTNQKDFRMIICVYSRVRLPPAINFSKIFHPGHFYFNPRKNGELIFFFCRVKSFFCNRKMCLWMWFSKYVSDEQANIYEILVLTCTKSSNFLW